MDYYDDTIVLNVSGCIFQLQKSLIRKFPGSLLFDLLYHNSEPRSSMGSFLQPPPAPEVTRLRKGKIFFIQRSPQMFDLVILQCYITGKLHIPKWMCPDSVIQELKFWRLEIDLACSQCCMEESASMSESENIAGGGGTETMNDATENGTAVLVGAEAIRKSVNSGKPEMISNWERIRRPIWEFLNNPSSSIGALLFTVFSLMVVLFSIVIFTIQSLKEFAYCPLDVTCNSTNNSLDSINTIAPTTAAAAGINYSTTVVTTTTIISTTTGINDWLDDTEYFCGFFSKCPEKRLLEFFELSCIAWFTIELSARLIFCPAYSSFFKSPLNLIDIASTVPYYVEMAVRLAATGIEQSSTHKHEAHDVIIFVQFLRCLRMLRILKLARYFNELQILGKTFKAAKNELAMLFLFVLIAIFLFSSMLYQLEKSIPDTQYESIPAACWFMVATLTTVGYGDVTPKTAGGKFVTSIACVVGLMITAFPVSILVEHFSSAYKTKSGKRMFVIPHVKYHVPRVRVKRRGRSDKRQTDLIIVKSVSTSAINTLDSPL